MNIRTLHPKVAPLMASATVLTATVEVAHEARASIAYVRQHCAGRFADEVARFATFDAVPDDEFQYHQRMSRYEMKAVVMTQAELAVLLTRAFEAGVRA